MFKYESEFPVRVEDVVEADNVAVLKLLQQADLAKGGGGNALRKKEIK